MYGWVTFKNGKPHSCGLQHTKRSLLIGYDMIPLRGLSQTEKDLKAKGYVIGRASISITDNEHAHCLVPTIKGKFNRELLGFSNWSMNYEQSFNSLVIYCWSDESFTVEEQNTFKRLFWFPKKDGRRKSTYTKLRAEVERILASRQIEIVPAVITLL